MTTSADHAGHGLGPDAVIVLRSRVTPAAVGFYLAMSIGSAWVAVATTLLFAAMAVATRRTSLTCTPAREPFGVG